MIGIVAAAMRRVLHELKVASLAVVFSPPTVVVFAIGATPIFLEELHYDLDDITYPITYANGHVLAGIWTDAQAQEFVFRQTVQPIMVILFGLFAIIAAAAVSIVIQQRVASSQGRDNAMRPGRLADNVPTSR